MQVEAMASSASTAAVTELHWIFNKAITCWGYELSRLSACACAGDTYTRCAPSLVLGNCTTIGLSLLYSGSSAIFTRLVALHIEAHYSTSPKLSEKMCGPETHYTPFSSASATFPSTGYGLVLTSDISDLVSQPLHRLWDGTLYRCIDRESGTFSLHKHLVLSVSHFIIILAFACKPFAGHGRRCFPRLRASFRITSFLCYP
jgi:hypothetical protein